MGSSAGVGGGHAIDSGAAPTRVSFSLPATWLPSKSALDPYADERVELQTPPVSLSVQPPTPEESTPAVPEPVPDLSQAAPVEALLQELQAAALKVSSVRPYRNQYISSTDSSWKLEQMQDDLRRYQERKAQQDAKPCRSHGVVGCQGPFGMRGWSLCVGCLVDCYGSSADAAEVNGIIVVASS